MKLEAIQAMISDPNIDPTGWVGKALIEWIQKNQATVLQDKTARKYIFHGMELTDVLDLSTGVRKLYLAKNDPEPVRGLIAGLKRIIDQSDEYNSWKIKSVIRELDSISDANLIDDLLDIKWDNCEEATLGFINALKPRHVITLLKNRGQDAWPPYSWRKLLSKVPPDELFTMFTDHIWPKLKRGGSLSERKEIHTRKDSWVTWIQDVLYDILTMLPPKDAKAWLEFLKTTTVDSLWFTDANHILISDRFKKDDIKYTETVCRCGFVTSNKSGYSLHSRSCERREALNLYKSAKIFLAKNSNALICDKCGKTCKSSPGLSLHKKKCKDESGNKLDIDRRLTEITRLGELKSVNKDENQVS